MLRSGNAGSTIAVRRSMRLVSALLFVGLTGSLAIADEAKPADPKPDSAAVSRRRVPLRVVRLLPETRQVLLFDRNRGTHVVAEVGQDVEGYRVDEIADDEVTLIAGNGAEIILTAPDTTQVRRKATNHKTGAAATDAAKAPESGSGDAPAMAPIDPYADADGAAPTATSASTAVPIAAGEGGMRVRSAAPSGATPAPTGPAGAPSDPYANMDPGIAAFVDAVGATPAPTPTAAPTPAANTPTATTTGAPAKTDAKVDAATALAAAATGSPAPVAAVAPSAKPSRTDVTISRAEIDTALADFGATAVTFDAAFVAEGLRIDQIAKGTILGKLGLEKGDVLTAVDNQPLHSLDDAASLYARAGTAKAATLHILRGGKATTLKVTIR